MRNSFLNKLSLRAFITARFLHDTITRVHVSCCFHWCNWVWTVCNIDFLQLCKIFFPFLTDSIHLLRIKLLSWAVYRNLLLSWPPVLHQLWSCHWLAARCYPFSLFFCKATIYAVHSTTSQCYWHSATLGKNIKVVKENILYSRHSTENWKQIPTKLKKIKSCKQNFCFLNKRKQQILKRIYKERILIRLVQ